VTRLPPACVESLSYQTAKEVKQTALHEALIDLKTADKGRSDLILKIEDMENRQKKAYLKLYERVSDQVGASLTKSVAQYEAEMVEQAQKDAAMTADELELARLKQMEEMGYGFKPNPAGEQQTLDDLFRKYNV